jgi:hypothetical protein
MCRPGLAAALCQQVLHLHLPIRMEQAHLAVDLQLHQALCC